MDNTNHTPSKRIDAKELTMLALLAALAYVVMFLSKQIPVNVLGFLNFDLKDVIVCITGFLFGPLQAAGVSLVVSFVEMITISSTGPWGLLMNVLSTCAFACTAAWFYQRQRTMKNAVIGLVVGVLLMTAVMLLWNYLITPIYMKAPREYIVTLLVPTFLPFNLIKGGINATLTILIYKPVVTALRKAKLVKPSTGTNQGGKKKTGVLIVAAVLLVTFILLALVLAKVI
ncbi:MAG: ECF transporter S component [Oscillospiraceae bacterium]|nr:ECF transporter S component [Oscillospiraceae bacterium]